MYITNIPDDILGTSMGIEKYMYARSEYGTFQMQNVNLIYDEKDKPVGVTGKFAGVEQKFVCKYDVIVIMATKRLCIDKVFELVKHTDNADTEETTNIVIGCTVSYLSGEDDFTECNVSFLSSSSSVSGYEEWRQTNDGTIQDYWDWLRKGNGELDSSLETEILERQKADSELLAQIKDEEQKRTEADNVLFKLIDDIIAGGGGGGSGESYAELIKLIGKKLSRENNDTAYGLITFLQGLVSVGLIEAEDGIKTGNFIKTVLWDGDGAYIDKDGNAWMRNLTLYESLSVPKLSYNMVEICPGFKWQSAGGGTIKEVEIEKTSEGNATLNGTITLDLKEGEIGQVSAGDLCMGIFHSLDSSQNATKDSDNGTGTMTRAGFYTCYFRITDILETEYNSKARYVLRNDSDWSLAYHPSAQMTFVAFGNPDREDRQVSCYQTTTYTRYLRKVTTWKFQPYNIAMQLGDLSNLTLFGYYLDGYSAFLNNVYVTGHIENIRDMRPYVTIRGLEDSHIEVGGSRTVTMLLTRDNINYKDAEWEVTRESGLPSSDSVWNEAHKSVSSPMSLSSSDLGEGAYLQAVMFTFTGKKTVTDEATGNPVSFEASSSSMITLISREDLWIDFECEKGKTFSVLYNDVDLKVTAKLMYGSSDITDEILLRSSTTMKWKRDSGVPSSDLIWSADTDYKGNTIHIIDKPGVRHDCGSNWVSSLRVTFIFECTVIFGAEIVPLSREINIG